MRTLARASTLENNRCHRLLLSSFGFLLLGYGTIRAFYDGVLSLPTSTSTTLSPEVTAVAFFQFLTGIGGSAGITAAMNATAKSFPDRSVRKLMAPFFPNLTSDSALARYSNRSSYLRIWTERLFIQ